MDIWTSAAQFMNSQLSWSTAKAACAVGVAGICSLFSTAVGLAHPSIPFLVALVCIDFALAAGIALCEDRFTWPGFRHGLGKFLAYALIFIVTSLSDRGMGIAGWFLNLTVGMSCYAIAGESVSCLRHIDHLFPGRLPVWVIERLLTFQCSIERDAAGVLSRQEGKEDWRGYWRTGEEGRSCQPGTAEELEDKDLDSCRGRIPEASQQDADSRTVAPHRGDES